MIRLYLIRIAFYVLNVGLKDGTSRLLAFFHNHNISLLSSLFTPKESKMAPQNITDDLTALDTAATATVSAATALNSLTDQQAAVLNEVATAVSNLQALDAAQQAALDKTISDINAAYGVAPIPPVANNAPMLMAAEPSASPQTGPFRALWAWVVANPQQALKIISWLALLFGIPVPPLTAAINALPKKS